MHQILGRLTCLAAVALACASTTASAAIKVTLSRTNTADAPSGTYDGTKTYGGSLLGGEFLATVKNTSTNATVETFKTFCLEYSEHISLGAAYYYTIDTYANNGGGVAGGAVGGIDPVSSATQYFYAAYRGSQLDDYAGFDYGVKDWGDALQLVFWRLEQEVKNDGTWKLPSGANPYGLPDLDITDKADDLWQFYVDNQVFIDNYATNAATAADAAKVKVINLWANSDYTGGKQSQLYYNGSVVPPPPPSDPTDPSSSVPEPATLAIWSLGLGITGLIRLRRRK